jgi:DNA polymerase I
LAATIDAELVTIRRELREVFGAEVNFDSPPQLQEAFVKIGVPLADTSEATLKKANHPSTALLLRYREAEMRNRQAQSLLKTVRGDRIYAEYIPLGAESGRFSSRNPNLQNVARDAIRNCFGPIDPDRALVICDFGQIEIRVAARLANDKKMLTAFEQGVDLHRATAAAVLAKPVAKVSKEDRQLAKAVNFGLLYGQGPPGLVEYAATTYNVTLDESTATEIRTRFFEHYRGLAAWHRSAWEKVKSTTEGRTASGRRRLLSESATDWNRFQVQINFSVQGSAADGLKYALILLSDTLPSEAKIVSTVHDEIIVECESNQAERVLELTKTAMCAGIKTVFPDLPVEVEGKVCRNWGEK